MGRPVWHMWHSSGGYQRPQGDVFLDQAGRDGQKPTQDAFIVGLLAHLTETGVPHSWTHLVKKLNFLETDWRFNTWVTTTGGSAGNVAKRRWADLTESSISSVRQPDEVPTLVVAIRWIGS